ncbi:MAG TPA: protein kinase [Thermoanaerobaculia bacterium]|nr:protein kinase [Thermoanaerobaculia bacterium]
MQLNAGRRLGPYEIISPIGTGGMGEVYRARDTRLNRVVALKILGAESVRDETQRLRFAREARAISSLAHPHICTLHDVGSDDGIDYLVMELLEGETLSEKLRRGPLPVDVVLRYGIEIADALEKAHSAGVIHRDLKPGNMVVTRSGVKLLDFGLADLRPARDARSEVTMNVEDEPVTGRGEIVGTLEYMAPEQLEGHAADERTDIFALGNVLYRMTTGRAPFAGPSRTAVVDAILHDSPVSIRDKQPDVPQALERLIFDCLRKEPDERIQAAHDVKLQLQSIAEALSTPAERRPDTRWLPWVVSAAAILTAVVVAVIFIDTPRSSSNAAVRRFTIELPDVPPAYAWGNRELAISPDGTRVVLSLAFEGQQRLYVRPFDHSELRALPGTEGGYNPFFSPDGRWIGFTSQGKLKKLLLSGGSPVVIADAPRLRGASWGTDGMIVFAPVSSSGGLSEVSADGGPVRPITRLEAREHERSHRWPTVLPDPRYVLFSIDDWGADYSRKKIAILDRKTGTRKTLIQGGTDPRYVDGYLLFAKERSLHAIRFDPESLSVSGLATPVVGGVTTHAGVGSISADVARDGTLVYVPYDAVSDERELLWLDRTGVATPFSVVRRPYWAPRLSPDQRQLIVGVGEARATDLWLLDIASASWSRIAEEGKSLAPLWSRDGSRIFFASNRAGPYNVYAVNSDGSGEPRKITESEHWPFPRSASPDGSVLLVEQQHPVTSYDVWQVDSAGGGSKPLLASPTEEFAPDFSPDGKFFVYQSNESNRTEIYVQQFPPSGRKWTVSQGGGTRPRWSPRGEEIFYRNGRQMLAASVTTPSLGFGAPRVLFEGDYASEYDVSPDGQRFVMLRASDRAREARLTVVLAWPAELERLMSARP